MCGEEVGGWLCVNGISGICVEKLRDEIWRVCISQESPCRTSLAALEALISLASLASLARLATAKHHQRI